MTLGLDDELFAVLDNLRQQYFPVARNFIPAHLTLFHALPGDHLDKISDRLTRIAEDIAPMPVRSAGLLDFGGGVAISMEVDGLAAIHAALRHDWKSWLTRQDDRKLRAHVTVQNKVDRATVLRTFAHLEETLPILTGTAVSLDLWHYRGGPWEAAGRFAFTG